MTGSPFQPPTWWSDPGPLGPVLSSALSASAGQPICVWATQDKYPQPAATAIAAVAAVDMHSGIRSVTFTFSSAVTIGGSSVTTHTVAAPRWCDVWGEGHFADYWCVRFDAGVLSSVTVDVSVTTMDGVAHTGTSLMGSGKESRVVTFVSSPTRVYVDASKADDSGDGLTAGTAKKTLSAVFTVASTTADEVIVAAGSYTMPTSWSMGARSKMLRWIGADRDTVTFEATSGTSQPTMGSWNAWENITIHFPGLSLRHSSGTNHVVYRNVKFDFDNVVFPAESAWFGLADPYIPFYQSSNIAIVNVEQSKGDSGITLLPLGGVNCSNFIFSGFKVHGTGTGMRPMCTNVLVERIEEYDNAMEADGWDPGTHFEAVHTYEGTATAIVNGCYRYILLWGNGDDEFNYNFTYLEDSSDSVAIYNNVARQVQSTQQFIQMGGVYNNTQIAHNTITASDSDGLLRGVRFSMGPGSNTVCVNNFVYATSQESTAFSGGTNMTSDYNAITNASSIDGAHTQLLANEAAAGFADAANLDFSITDDSPLAGAGRATDIRFDRDGMPRTVTAPSIGAKEAP